MIITHADRDYQPLCGETMPDSSGLVATALHEDDVDCPECLEMLGDPPALLPFG